MKNSRSTISQTLDIEITLEKILSWSQRFNPVVILNSNSKKQFQDDKYKSDDLLIAIESIETLLSGENVFDSLKSFHQKHLDWIFGYLSYDVKTQIEKLHSNNFDGILAGDYYFFCPRYIFGFKGQKLIVHYLPESDSAEDVYKLIESLRNFEPVNRFIKPELQIKSRINKNEYIDKVDKIKKHIHRGDIYEMNYCMEFYAENAVINPFAVYLELNNLSPMPFSAYFHINNHYLMCASPERFLAMRGNKIISQPIKGTAKRGATGQEDKMIIESLKNDPKEQAENVMIVDLVRNDLSRTATRGSVIVEELFGVKSFHQLHQMVSTVTSELKKDVPFTEVIKNAFPMGSMTGAPKIRAMELIEEYESTKRGIYSGSIGYITPDGDFDFNVIIRSILYNAENRYLSFMAGSAITNGADPEREYEECLLKAATMKKVLGLE